MEGGNWNSTKLRKRKEFRVGRKPLHEVMATEGYLEYIACRDHSAFYRRQY